MSGVRVQEAAKGLSEADVALVAGYTNVDAAEVARWSAGGSVEIEVSCRLNASWRFVQRSRS